MPSRIIRIIHHQKNSTAPPSIYAYREKITHCCYESGGQWLIAAKPSIPLKQAKATKRASNRANEQKRASTAWHAIGVGLDTAARCCAKISYTTIISNVTYRYFPFIYAYTDHLRFARNTAQKILFNSKPQTQRWRKQMLPLKSLTLMSSWHIYTSFSMASNQSELYQLKYGIIAQNTAKNHDSLTVRYLLARSIDAILTYFSLTRARLCRVGRLPATSHPDPM